MKSILQPLFFINSGTTEMKARASPACFLCLLVKDEHMLSRCSLSYLSELETAPDSERLPHGAVAFISMGLEKQMQ